MHRANIAVGAIAALSNALAKLGDAAKASGHVLSNHISALSAVPSIRQRGGGKARHGWNNGHHGVHRKACSARKKAKAKARRRRMRRAA